MELLLELPHILLLYVAPSLYLGLAIFLFNKSDKTKNNKKSFYYTSLGINLLILPFSLFIGGFATDSGDSWGFLYGFLFLQGIPLILLFISTIRHFNNRRKD